MANKMKQTVRLGIFVTTGAILFTLAVYYIGNRQNLFGAKYRISTMVNNAYGLQVGNNVRYAGITVGSVENITFVNDSTLKVDFILEDDVRNFIKQDALASIGTDGLVGNVIVNISPGYGNGMPVKDGDYIQSFSRNDPNEMLKTLGNTNENIALLSLNMLEIIEKINNGEGTLSRLTGDAQMAKDLAQTVANLKVVSNHFILMTGELQASIKQISDGDGLLNYLIYDNTLAPKMEAMLLNADSLVVQGTQPIIDNLNTSSQDLMKASSELKIALENLNEREGLAKTILQDTTAAEDLKETLENLNEGTARFNENMEALKHNFLFKKYFKKQAKKKASQEEEMN